MELYYLALELDPEPSTSYDHEFAKTTDDLYRGTGIGYIGFREIDED